MSIHIDSSNRNINQYLSNTDFKIPINQINNGQRTNKILNSDVELFFRWIGNSENNNPFSKQINDTFLTKIIPISSNKCIIIPANEYVEKIIYKENYFNGVKLWFKYNNKIGTVISYNHESNTITLDSNIFQYYFENIDYLDYKNKNLIEFFRDAYLINTSFHQDNNIILLGQTTDIHSDYIIENVSKRWRSKLVKKYSNYFIENLVGPYDLLDTFIVYPNDRKNTGLYSIEYQNYSNGEILSTNPLLHINKANYIILIINQLTYEKKYFEIQDINNSNKIIISDSTNESLTFPNQIISILPIQNNFSTLTIDQNEYKKKVFLTLRSLIIPNEIIKPNLKIYNIPFIILKLNQDITINKLSSNIPDMKSSFICFCSNLHHGNYVEFRSSQTIELREIFRNELKFSILLPNNKKIIEFENTNIQSFSEISKNLLIYDSKNIISAIFEIKN